MTPRKKDTVEKHAEAVLVVENPVNENTRLVKRIEELNTFVKNVETELKDIKDQIAILTSTVDPLGEKVDSVLKTNLAIGRTIQTIKTTTENHKAKQSEFEDLLKKLNTSISEAQKFINDIQTKQVSATESIQSLDTKRKDIEKRLKDHITEVTENLSNVKKVTKHVTFLETRVGGFENLIKNSVKVNIAGVAIIVIIAIGQMLNLFNLIGDHVKRLF